MILNYNTTHNIFYRNMINSYVYIIINVLLSFQVLQFRITEETSVCVRELTGVAHRQHTASQERRVPDGSEHINFYKYDLTSATLGTLF